MDIALRDLLNDPTVAGIADAVDRASAAATPATGTAGSKRSHRLVVPIQPAGSRPPLFLVHPISGGIACYAELASKLGSEQPVYGIRAGGLDDGVAPDSEIVEMARGYLASLRSIYPEGPVLLGGWSFGGFVAFEMARILRSQGEDVGLLVMIDVGAPTGESDVLELADVWHLRAVARDLAQLQGRRLELSHDELAAVSGPERSAFVLERMRREGLIATDHQLESTRRQLEVCRANDAASCSYQGGTYDGSVLLLLALESVLHLLALEALEGDEHAASGRLYPDGGWQSGRLYPDGGWQSLVTGELTTVTLPGTHYTMLRPPQVETVARLIESHRVRDAAVERSQPVGAEEADSDGRRSGPRLREGRERSPRLHSLGRVV